MKIKLLLVTFLIGFSINNTFSQSIWTKQNLRLPITQQISQLGVYYTANDNFNIGYSQNVLISKNYQGFYFFDVTNPSNIILSSTMTSPISTYFEGIAIDGNYAYLGGYGYLMIVDISNINTPNQVGITYGIYSSIGIPRIKINGNYVFITLSDTLYAVDISNKASPSIASKLGLGGSLTGLCTMNNYAYASSSIGMKVVDISTPQNMSLIASFGSDYHNISIDTIGNRCFATDSTGFDAIDISNPNNPNLLFHTNTQSSVNRIDYSMGYVFMINPGNKIIVYQIDTNSANYLSSYTNFSSIWDMVAKDSIFYISTNYDIQVLKIGNSPTGVGAENKKLCYDIYPNPSNGIFNIDLCNFNNQEIQISLYNSLGNMITSTKEISIGNKTNIKKLDLSTFPKGVYFLRISSCEEVLVRKLILQ